MIKVFFDGACWPNPGGPCRYGYVIYETDKGVLHSASGFVGEGKGMSNNVGEFAGLYHALSWLVEQKRNTERIIIKGDSKLVIKLMKGRWHPRGGSYTDLYLKVRMVKWKFPNISFKWVPRECNTEVDRLSKRGLKKDEHTTRLPVKDADDGDTQKAV